MGALDAVVYAGLFTGHVPIRGSASQEVFTISRAELDQNGHRLGLARKLSNLPGVGSVPPDPVPPDPSLARKLSTLPGVGSVPPDPTQPDRREVTRSVKSHMAGLLQTRPPCFEAGGLIQSHTRVVTFLYDRAP